MAVSRLNLDEPDISEQAEIEARLRESEERYRDLVEHSHDLICTYDLEGRILSVSRTAARAIRIPVPSVFVPSVFVGFLPPLTGLSEFESTNFLLPQPPSAITGKFVKPPVDFSCL